MTGVQTRSLQTEFQSRKTFCGKGHDDLLLRYGDHGAKHDVVAPRR